MAIAKKIGAFLAATLFVVVATALGLEVGARVLDRVPVFHIQNYVAADLGRDIHHASNRYDPVLGWVLNDNMRHGAPGNTFTTGRLGLRMNSPEIAEPADGAVIAVGDSFTAGSEVSDEHSWPAQLEALLGRPVLNGGVGGYGADQIVLRAESLIEPLQPAAIIVSWLADDVLRIVFRSYGAPKPWFAIENNRLALSNVPVPDAREMAHDLDRVWRILAHSYVVYRASKQFGIYPRLIQRKAEYVQPLPNAMAVPIACLLVERLVRLRDERRLPIVLVMQYGGPDSIAADPPWYGKDVVACARRAGLAVVDTHLVQHAIAQRSLAEFQTLFVMHEGGRVYGHMSAAGNRLVAELVKAALDRVGYSAER